MMDRQAMIELAVRRVYPFEYIHVGFDAACRSVWKKVWNECEPHIAEDDQIVRLVRREFHRIVVEQVMLESPNVTDLASRRAAR